MVKLQFVSDLHLEFRGMKFKNLFEIKGDILCLAGDICACGNPEDWIIFEQFIKFIAPKYLYVLHVAGNHEYYTSGVKNIKQKNTMQGIHTMFKLLQKQVPNYHFLNNKTICVKVKESSYYFCGTTLWANINKKDYTEIESRMNDYSAIYFMNSKGKIQRFTAEEEMRLFRKNAAYIKNTIAQLKEKKIKDPVVLITHHKPIGDTPAAQVDVLTQAYESDLTDIIKPPIKLAIHGHTHKYYKKVINKVLYYSNPLGYLYQKTGFIKTLVVNI